MMRSVTVYAAFLVLLAPLCLAAAQAADLDTPQKTTAANGQLRALLQNSGSTAGARTFASVAQHKTPRAPSLTRKSFDAKFPKRALLEDAMQTEDADVLDSTTGRQLQQNSGSTAGARTFASVAQHKTPRAPSLTRKSFDAKFPKRALLEDAMQTEDADVLDSTTGRQLQQNGVRAFASVAQFKQPATPQLSRKTFERKAPLL